MQVNILRKILSAVCPIIFVDKLKGGCLIRKRLLHKGYQVSKIDYLDNGKTIMVTWIDDCPNWDSVLETINIGGKYEV